jgi:hypothetical protein
MERWRRQRPGRLRLIGARWPDVVVIEITTTGIVIEAPASPPLAVGTVTHVEVDGLRGRLIAESAFTDPATDRVYYTIRASEEDAGMLEALQRQALRRGGFAKVFGTTDP